MNRRNKMKAKMRRNENVKAERWMEEADNALFLVNMLTKNGNRESVQMWLQVLLYDIMNGLERHGCHIGQAESLCREAVAGAVRMILKEKQEGGDKE